MNEMLDTKEHMHDGRYARDLSRCLYGKVLWYGSWSERGRGVNIVRPH